VPELETELESVLVLVQGLELERVPALVQGLELEPELVQGRGQHS